VFGDLGNCIILLFSDFVLYYVNNFAYKGQRMSLLERTYPNLKCPLSCPFTILLFCTLGI